MINIYTIKSFKNRIMFYTMNYSVLSGPPDIEKGTSHVPYQAPIEAKSTYQNPVQSKATPLASQYNSEDLFTAFQDKDVRKNFIKKVYGILTCQLLFTFSVGLILNAVDGARDFAISQGGQALMWISIVGMFATIIAMACNQNLARNYPSNYVMLCLFTSFTSYLVAVVTLAYQINSVLAAFGLTAGITVALTIYAFQTKYDYTDMGGYLLVILVGVILTGIINIFIQNQVLQLIIAGVSSILFSFYIVYDTQQIVGGDHKKYQFGVDDYVFAAITLYLDIINLFLSLLQLMGKKK